MRVEQKRPSSSKVASPELNLEKIGTKQKLCLQKVFPLTLTPCDFFYTYQRVNYKLVKSDIFHVAEKSELFFRAQLVLHTFLKFSRFKITGG